MKKEVEVITSDYLNKLPHKLQVYFAVFCAKQVTHLLSDKNRDVSLKAIAIAELWLEGKATSEECRKAAVASYAGYAAYAAAAGYAAAYAADAAGAGYAAEAADAAAAAGYAADAAGYAYAADAAGYAAYAAEAAGYADAAGYAAYAADKQKIISEQWDYYYELLNIDENLERVMLDTDPIFK
jgi:hypothetical protein